MPTPAEQYETFMKSEETKLARPRCGTCKNSVVTQIIAKHLDALASGKTAVTLSHVHKYLLLDQGAPTSYSAICHHVNLCLRRNVATGEPHGQEA